MWVSIDPGIRHSGVAVWEGSTLIWAGVAIGEPRASVPKPIRWQMMATHIKLTLPPGRPTELVFEFPEIYRRSKARPNDLMLLAGLCGYIVSTVDAEKTTLHLPKSWKGQLPKEVCVERVKSKLTAEELSRVVLPRGVSYAHNAFDGIGIGLYSVKRF